MCNCGEPCLVPDWQNGKYGYRCTNCNTFTEA